MADIFEPNKRSEIMGKIRSKNTKAELLVFRYLRRRKVYFQKHYNRAPGSPDLALPRKKRAVFIDGDFWHGRTLERVRLSRVDPNDYWVKKLEKNIARDAQQNQELIATGWEIIRVWESDLIRKSTSLATLEMIVNFLNKTNDDLGVSPNSNDLNHLL
jgi:DNA mismatch endonuclease (patch repair protein)